MTNNKSLLRYCILQMLIMTVQSDDYSYDDLSAEEVNQDTLSYLDFNDSQSHSSDCEYHESTYQDNEYFYRGINDCSICLCKNRNVSCNDVGCQEYINNQSSSRSEYDFVESVEYNYEEEHSDIKYTNEYPGPYCATRYPKSTNGTCCNDRMDSCSVQISTTLCYCDEFCDQHNNPDCCPDYESHCKGMPPATFITCLIDGFYFTPYDPPKLINCNSCTCQHDGKVLCEMDTCLSDINMISKINAANNLGWSARNYTSFFGRKLADGLSMRLGTFEPPLSVKKMTRLSNKKESFPERFSSLENWPGFISDIRDQGWCGSSWAVSTTSVASDRFSVKSNGREIVDFAPQQLLSCAKRQQGCFGGHLDIAWNYLRNRGGVDEDLYPYKENVTKCSTPSTFHKSQIYKMGPAYALNKESDIMWEILHHGPVQATMRVYHDFFLYQTGIYQRSSFGADERSGFHSVRLIGWGEDRHGSKTIKYWIAANSWGKWWGEDGFFNILRGSNECEIENYVLSSLPVIQKKHDKSLDNIDLVLNN